MQHGGIAFLKAFLVLFFVSVAVFFTVSALEGARSGAVVSSTDQEAESLQGSRPDLGLAEFKRKFIPGHAQRLQPAWEVSLGGDAFLHQDGRVLYATSTRGRVMSLDASSGTTIWSLDLGTWVSAPPRVAQGVVYIGATNYTLYALDAGTGALLWHYPVQGEILAQPLASGGMVFVCADNDSVYNLVYRLYALDARSGRLLWTHDTRSWTPSAPAAGDGMIYVGGYGRDVYALDRATGEISWSFSTPNIIFSSPQLAGGRLLLSCIDGSVYSLDAASGDLAWSAKLPGLASLVPGDGAVYAYSDAGVTALSLATGERLWQFRHRHTLSCSALEGGEAVYVFDQRGRAHDLDPASGEQRRLLLLPYPFSAPPLLVGDLLFAGTADGFVRAYRIPVGENPG